ncbi:MAG TPA: putative baseplate assembly protein [Nannocystaceae bacterium]|nr:putative baseplate assembly protein [Nannocystaceae bacterium]
MSDASGHCCTDGEESPRENPPGLPRVTIHRAQPKVLARMLEALPDARVEPVLGGPPVVEPQPLRSLTARSTDDASIALLDAWACACDVLGFYGEQLLNEGFLGTASERRSLLELARALGYEPNPGVAASVRVAFTIDPNAADTVDLAVGLPIGSIPAPGALPQTFEIVESLEARNEWNEIAAATTRRQHLAREQTEIWLAGMSTRLVKGDALVLFGGEVAPAPGEAPGPGDERWDFRRVAEVVLEPNRGVTRIVLDRGLGDDYTLPAGRSPTAAVLRRRAGLFGMAAPNPAFMSFPTGTSRNDWVEENVVDGVKRFEWRRFDLADDPLTKRGEIDLDREHDGILGGSWVVLQIGLLVELYRVRYATPRKRQDFGLSGKCTRLRLDKTSPLAGEDLAKFERRSTTVFFDSDVLPLAEAPWAGTVSGRFVELDRVITELPVGRRVIVTGIGVDGSSVVHESTVKGCVVAAVDTTRVAARTILELAESLPKALLRGSIRVLANVALATHGASVSEALGHGDASAAHVSMWLRQSPLTWIPAATVDGALASLVLWVDGLRWSMTPSLFECGPTDRVYELRTDDDGRSVVTFGDGLRGARLPSGIENVLASYRKGIGVAGEVAAGSLSVLPMRPSGLRAAINPSAAEGGADPEPAEQIRENANLRGLTLDRLVSVQDYEDFARAFAGIGKASAAELWDGKRAFVHLTIASASGAPLGASSETRRRLAEAIAAYADPSHVASLGTFVRVPFRVDVAIVRDPAFDKVALKAAIRAALVAAFSFGARAFAQPVTAAEVLATLHRVPGVTAIDLDALYIGDTPSSNARLTAAPATWSGATVKPTELLVIDEDGITVRWIES